MTDQLTLCRIYNGLCNLLLAIITVDEDGEE